MASATPQDHLHLRGEINFDESHGLRPHGQWSNSSPLRERTSRTGAGCDKSKDDGLRLKDPIETLVRGMGRERKRSTGAIYDGISSDRKRRKNQPDWGLKQNSSTVTTTSTETAAHLLRFLEKRFEQRCPASTSSCSSSKQANKAQFKQKSNLDFDPFLLLNTWSLPSPQGVISAPSATQLSTSTSLQPHRRRFMGHRQPYYNSLDCRQQHASPEKCQCRKRIFADAIELSRPFAMSADVANHHPNWVESVKKRKIHQNATKWTSALSPAPYVRLLTLRNFWEVMKPRQDLSWMSEDDGQGSDEDKYKNAQGDDKAKKGPLDMEVEIQSTVKSAWQQNTVRKPIRGKIYHAKPIVNLNKQNKPSFPSLFTGQSSSSKSSTDGQDSNMGDTKDRAAHAITEGSDMSEYKPWKDGTIMPRQGSLQGLKASRSNIMDPWPIEEAKSKDECMRVLHRMREQLNIVINLQIHLRSMMKTAPGQWSFLLSIRHPGQVSIELLLALYGPHFMQTSNFRAIEELLWGAKGHSQQAAATSSSSIDATSSASPALVQT
ncbi:hypothetical protein EC991_005315 [Linnemannia zychae]|nr:hypothetical protein EC991_005315 [Linnemannia zychae]